MLSPVINPARISTRGTDRPASRIESGISELIYADFVALQQSESHRMIGTSTDHVAFD